jgi:sirohydrochlorin cobaltochelatase
MSLPLLPSVARELASLAAFPPGIGVLVVGHGTADPVGVAETRVVADRIAEILPGVPVGLGFLEVLGPTIADAMATLAAAGCREVIVAPLLLFEAGHAKRDIPDALLAEAATQRMLVHQAGPLGCHPAIVALARRRRREAVDGAGDVAPSETTLVMVGRGSSDPAAAGQLQSFAAATLADEPPPRRLLFGFVAAARPSLADAIEAAGDPTVDGVRRIIVQPHLLFRGHVEEQVIAAIDEGRARRPDLEWVRVARLGPDPLVAEAVVARAAAKACDRGSK